MHSAEQKAREKERKRQSERERERESKSEMGCNVGYLNERMKRRVYAS